MMQKILALLAGGVLLVLAFLFSVVVLAVVAVVGLCAFAYFWWKTRALRQALREQAAQAAATDGQVIEGEAVVVTETRQTSVEILPAVVRRE